MPGGNGTGPFGQGGAGQGRGRGGPSSAGPGGNCVCSQCGYKAPHQQGQPCNQVKCPKCGSQMTRE